MLHFSMVRQSTDFYFWVNFLTCVGTLMVPGVLYRVIYGSPFPEEWQKGLTHMRPALLRGYRRHKVKFCDYPAVVPFEGASVRGSICHGQ